MKRVDLLPTRFGRCLIPVVIISGTPFISSSWLSDLFTFPFTTFMRDFTLDFFLLFLFDFFSISVKEHINHNIPWLLTRYSSSQTQDFSCQKVPSKTNRMFTF